ncbi:MAG: hypothetical protein SOW38_04185 [Succinivibrio sp.]|nr:hypothetical protein [Succinivibrio sp.]
MKRIDFVLSIAIAMAVSSAVTHCVDTYYVNTHSKPTNAKDIKPCTINVTTENASFYDSGYINVIATSDKKD